MPAKILIIRFSSIGDIVLTTPVIRCLRLQTGTEIHFLTKPAFASIASSNPHISKVITLSGDFKEMMEMLRNENYDHIIDLHHNIRTARIKTGLKKPSSSFHKLNFEKWLMVQFKINRLPAKHIVDRYMETATHLGVKNDNQGLDFFIPVEKQIDIAVMFGFAPHSYVSIVIGAAHNTKCMTSSQISLLCDYLNKPVILLGGKQEAGKADEIIAKSNSKTIKSACGVLDIFQSGSVTKQSASFITHDTGLMHIAAALKKPQVVVWGNTIPEFGMYPYYGSHNINWHSFEIKGLRCRPCSKLGYAKCPRGHFRCMLDHDLVKIAEKAMEIIG